MRQTSLALFGIKSSKQKEEQAKPRSPLKANLNSPSPTKTASVIKQQVEEKKDPVLAKSEKKQETKSSKATPHKQA